MQDPNEILDALDNPVFTASLWSLATRLRVSIDVVAEEIKKIQDANNGECTAALLLQSARSTSSPLHSAFEWNDEVAAEKYRLQQAGALIRAVRIVVKDDGKGPPKTVRAFISTRKVDETELKERRVYISTNDALRDPDARGQLLRDAIRDVHAYMQRYRHFSELATLFAEIDKLQLSPPPVQPKRKRKSAA
jgi:hypothetical protein